MGILLSFIFSHKQGRFVPNIKPVLLRALLKLGRDVCVCVCTEYEYKCCVNVSVSRQVIASFPYNYDVILFYFGEDEDSVNKS